MFGGFIASGAITLDPQRNFLGGHAPYYRCYRCADGRYMSVGAIEPRFWAELLHRIGAPEAFRERQGDPTTWPERVAVLAGIFATRTRDEWDALLTGTDACAAPVLGYAESMAHPQVAASYVEANGIAQAAPAPRLSRTPGTIGASGDGAALLDRWRSDVCG